MQRLYGNQQIHSGTVQRGLLDIATPGQAVVSYVEAGSGISLQSTGIDPGTGKVSISTVGTIPNDGWIAGTGTWSYSSADDPTFVISINADVTTILQAGMRIKLTQTTAKYFIVTAIGSYSSGTTPVIVYGGTDYDLANATITNPYYSPVKCPFGFPLGEDKWSIEATDTSNISQASPTQNSWYNLTLPTLAVPIGKWKLEYTAHGYYIVGASHGGGASCCTTLSTTTNSESDANFTDRVANVVYTGVGELFYAFLTARPYVIVTLASKTTYNMLIKTMHTGMNTIGVDGGSVKTRIRAICDYL